jgi:hypothetical protein
MLAQALGIRSLEEAGPRMISGGPLVFFGRF